MSIQRYNPTIDHDSATMERWDDGDFVRFEDFQRMTEEIATKIDEVWRKKGGLNCTEICAIVRAYGTR